MSNLPLGYRLILALLAGAALPLAFSPYEWWPIALLSPAILYALLQQRSAKHAFWIGEAYGIGLWCVGAFWLYTSIHVYGDTPAPLALLMIGFVGVSMGLFHAVMAWAYRRFVPESPLTFAPIWVVFEWLKTWLFTGFPWLFVGYGFTGKGLDGFAPVAGVLAVSFVVVLIAAALVEVCRGRRYWLVPAILLVVLAIGLDQVRWTTPKTSPALSVSLVQGNIPQDLKWLTEYRVKTLEIYTELSETEWGRDLVVWPEASIPMFQSDPEARPFIEQVELLAAATNSAWVTGIPWQANDEYNPFKDDYPPFYNSIMARGASGDGLYHKQRLVPFGEYIPFEGALKWVLPNLKRNMEVSSFSAGRDDQAPLQVKGHPLAAAICYEVAYPNLTRKNARDSDFLVTLSNDAWFGTSAGPLQHLQMVQMRAKETGRWFIRATNTGVTAFIDDQGTIVRRTAQFEPAVLRGDLPAMQGLTPYMRWGDWPILAISMLLLFLGLYFQRQRLPANAVSLRSKY
ncbi:MAG: apolipoprotein N-acyltransferase [Pseudomonadota bacterium]|nr:apolipoprotein N-acyltransferase [Pseudomonadota bacterium]